MTTKVTLEFDDLDQLAEFIWALITKTIQTEHLTNAPLNHGDWLALSPQGKKAAYEIALEMTKIFGGTP